MPRFQPVSQPVWDDGRSVKARQVEPKRVEPTKGKGGAPKFSALKYMPKFLKPAPTQGGTPAGARTFRRDWAVVYYGMQFPRSAPGKSAPFVQIRHRQTKPAAAPCRASQLSPRPLPTLEARLRVDIKGVRSARYGPTQPKRGVVGCRLWLLAPLRARGKTPSGQVSRSQEVYGC